MAMSVGLYEQRTVKRVEMWAFVHGGKQAKWPSSAFQGHFWSGTGPKKWRISLHWTKAQGYSLVETNHLFQSDRGPTGNSVLAS